MCECELCVIFREFKRAIEFVSDDLAKQVFEQLYDRMSHLECDADYTNANLDGSWESSPFKAFGQFHDLKPFRVVPIKWKRVYEHEVAKVAADQCVSLTAYFGCTAVRQHETAFSSIIQPAIDSETREWRELCKNATDTLNAERQELERLREALKEVRQFIPAAKPEQGPLPEWIAAIRIQVDAALSKAGVE